MIVVNKRQVDLVDGKLVAEASSLELPPGEWPDFISVVDDTNQGFLFLRSTPQPDGGYLYQSRGGAQLLVLND